MFDALVTLAPRVSVNLGPDLDACMGDTVLLDAGSTPGVAYLWNTGQGTPTLAPTSSGTYILMATNGYCSDSDTVAVLFHAVPVNILADQTACIGQSATLDAGNAGSTYSWSNGGTEQVISVGSPGTYSVHVTNASGCSADFGAEVAFVPPPSVDLGPDTVLCAGQLLTLDAGNPGSTFTWSTGATSPTLSVGTGGNYTVSVDNGHCSVSDAVAVIFNPAPTPMPAHHYFTCLDEEPHSVPIDAGNAGSSFLWNDGRTTQTVNAAQYGWWSVEITNAFGCSRLDSALVEEFCRPSIFIPNTFTPNGDGRNDVWLVAGNNIVEYDMQIFDRWGGVLFHSTSVDQGWDGTANGRPMPNDVYVFQVTFRLQEDSSGHLGFEQTKLGHVQVLR
jgi:gliding motility-associated-like protein